VAAVAAAGVDIRAGRVEAFGGDDQVVAFMRHQAAEDFLGLALGIGVGAVEEVDAAIPAGCVHGGRARLVGVAAEGHGAEAELRDLEPGAAE
jgi:hypothetical protein